MHFILSMPVKGSDFLFFVFIYEICKNIFTRKSSQDQKIEKDVKLLAYRTSEGKPWVLPVVKKVERALAEDELQNHEYLPVLGLDAFSQAAIRLLLGSNSPTILQGKVIGVQCLSGTGALRVGAEFLSRILRYDTFYYSSPTWGTIKL